MTDGQPHYYRGPVALIVGCGDMGMGAARLIGHHHPLFLINTRQARLDQAVEALRSEGYVVSGKTCDITDPVQTALLGNVLGQGPGVRTIAHVAAIGGASGDWRKILSINLMGVHHIVNAVRPHMVRGGAAVFVSSAGAYLAEPDPTRDALLEHPLAPDFFDALIRLIGREPTAFEAYCYSKRALNSYARRLAVEWGPDEVRSVSVSPGSIYTSMSRLNRPTAEGRGDLIRQVPLGREGTTHEACALIAFLASDAASYVTGVDVLIDGGFIAGKVPTRTF
jgi:NAD(P)-dependent dehydrogenase (short-subunit alcohol dehydrogenase family)